MYIDVIPALASIYGLEPWTVALVSPEGRETHFGIFATPTEAREAMNSGKVTVMEGQTLHIRRIRRFPS
jgi:hypothetical protein